MSAPSTLRSFDAYAKPLDDFRIRTRTGGIVTLVSAIVILLLVASEWMDYMTPEHHTRLIVDPARKEKMDIYLNITFPRVPCMLISMDVMDVSGEHHNGLTYDVFKTRLDPAGNVIVDSPPEREQIGNTVKKTDVAKAGDGKSDAPKKEAECGSCYGAKPPESGCCNTCQDVEEAYGRQGWAFTKLDHMEQCVREGYAEKMKAREKEGCNIHGKLTVNKVAGNFHFAPGRSFDQAATHVHDISALLSRQFDFSHTIHHLSFGPMVKGIKNPLDWLEVQVPSDRSHLIQYFLKVVGTEYTYLNGTTVITNQFAVTEHHRDVSGPGGQGHAALPGVFFNFDMAAMRVIQSETQKPLIQLLTSLCAVVGGVATVAGLVDAGLYRAGRALERKAAVGKLA
ncbi:Endoplasmic reticulum-Golgi intermediate compartment protein 3 [Allomyces javanicus]|nr:Endoplasmic reticulum-Golgi intermediate compartment protein 3 [Allomyces javanicus]